MERSYYKEYYDFERRHWWFRARKEIIRSLIIKYSGRQESPRLKILNIGVATGSSTVMLEEFGDVTSVEYDKECCEFLAEKTGIKAINASIEDLPFDDRYFDMVCAFDVIEHVADDVKAISEMKRVSRQKALLFITVPAFMFLWSRHDDVNHHFRRYTLTQVNSLLASCNLKGMFVSYFNFFLFFPIAFYRLFIGRIFSKRKGAGSDFEINNQSQLLNEILFKVFRFEKNILSKSKIQVGVSIVAVVRNG